MPRASDATSKRTMDLGIEHHSLGLAVLGLDVVRPVARAAVGDDLFGAPRRVIRELLAGGSPHRAEGGHQLPGVALRDRAMAGLVQLDVLHVGSPRLVESRR